MKAIIYSKPDCQGCQATKRQCLKLSVTYEERQIDDHPQVKQSLQEMNWTMMPYVQITDETGNNLDHWNGFKPERLKNWANQ
ncbi:glutaredoxin domain-containing protein [Staphylococcus chromogenes]|nr:glutaredoxin domain-containing protein [Staphylococcus chromogenes]